MKVYLAQPSDDTLGRWALTRFLDASVITLASTSGPRREFIGSGDVPYTFTADYLWALLCQDQDALTPDEKLRAEFVGA